MPWRLTDHSFPVVSSAYRTRVRGRAFGGGRIHIAGGKTTAAELLAFHDLAILQRRSLTTGPIRNVSSLTVPRLSVTGAVCLPLEQDVFLTAYCHMTGGHLTREEDLF